MSQQIDRFRVLVFHAMCYQGASLTLDVLQNEALLHTRDGVRTVGATTQDGRTLDWDATVAWVRHLVDPSRLTRTCVPVENIEVITASGHIEPPYSAPITARKNLPTSEANAGDEISQDTLNG